MVCNLVRRNYFEKNIVTATVSMEPYRDTVENLLTLQPHALGLINMSWYQQDDVT